MNLPKKDKNGNSYLSYSQINLFLKSPKQYYEQVILDKPFKGNEYTDFGTQVGAALELNMFGMFSDAEKEILSKVKRLDIFERATFLKYDDFYVIGYIDTISSDFKKIIDYKTGGKKKELEYMKEDYTQLHYYALGIEQETGITPIDASVEFIRRGGNLYKGQPLIVSDEFPINIPVDISRARLDKVYNDTKDIAKEIELFYTKCFTN
jgi:hypothetical protein